MIRVTTIPECFSISISMHSTFNTFASIGKEQVVPKYGGLVLPGSNHIGPGNNLNNVPVLSKADGVARIHDIEYNKAVSQKEVRQADLKAIKSFWNTGSIQGKIGAAGLGIKYAGESLLGVKYPNNLPIISGKMYSLKQKYYKTYPDLAKANNESRKSYFDAYPDYRHLFDVTEEPVNKKFKTAHQGVNPPSSVGSVEGHISDIPSSSDASSSPTPSPSSSGERYQPSSSSNVTSSQDITDTPVSSSTDMSVSTLPGTGKPQGDNGSPGTDQYYITFCKTKFGKKLTTYSKTFNFVSDCFESNIVSYSQGLVNFNVATSELLEIPWHLPVMYMSPSEFSLLKPGARAVHLRCKVVFRGCTVKFETNASSTQIATLNTVQNLRAAVGLNLTGWGSNYFYDTLSPTNPMEPTNVVPAIYGATNGRTYNLIEELYGNAARTTIPPRYTTGNYVVGRNYWCESTQLPLINGSIGWPASRLDKCNTWDGKTMINQVIVDAEYEPNIAPLNETIRYYRETAQNYPLNNIEINGTLCLCKTE